jgi:hypothetical protein
MIKKMLFQKNRSFKRRMITIIGGSFFFMLMKMGLVALMKLPFPEMQAWLNYLIVTTSITVIGWLYHSTISFQTGLTVESMKRYFTQAVVLKALDYGIYNLCFYVIFQKQVDEWIIVVPTSALIFTLRVITYFKYVFVADEPRAGIRNEIYKPTDHGNPREAGVESTKVSR